MSFKQRAITLILATAVAGSIAALATPLASATLGGRPGEPDAPGQYVVNNAHTASQADGIRLITDTLAPGGGDSSSDAVDRYVANHGERYRFITDTLAGGGDAVDRYVANHGGAAHPTQGYRFITDTLAPGGGVVATTPKVDRFSWRDTGIGFSAAFVLLAVALGVRIMLHQRKPAVA
jgi:hypothetical protein